MRILHFFFTLYHRMFIGLHIIKVLRNEPINLGLISSLFKLHHILFQVLLLEYDGFRLALLAALIGTGPLNQMYLLLRGGRVIHILVLSLLVSRKLCILFLLFDLGAQVLLVLLVHTTALLVAHS